MLVNQLVYPQPIEEAIAKIVSLLSDDYQASLILNYPISQRTVALLLLQKDEGLWATLRQQEPQILWEIEQAIAQAQQQLDEPLTSGIANARQQLAWSYEREVLSQPTQDKYLLSEWLHQITINPVTGFPLLVVILYYGVYKFVGEFGAGTLVDTIETFFENNINPIVNDITAIIFPWQPIQDLIGNDYGIITLGVRYAVAIILPIVTTFFLMFSLLEDSGYLPRISLLIDRLFKTIGLSGRAVIPLVLGLGCGTMATLVTRTLESKRERLIATLLLALTIPCSAQLGVVLGLLSQSPPALLLWSGIMVAIFLVIGYFSHRVLPGKHPCFYMEIPPLRLPRPQAILMKTYVRLKWYFGEILPLFIIASVFIWIGKLTGIFDLLISGLQPLMKALSLPPTAAQIFLYGFFRRDYGAAGLLDLQQQGALTSQQLLVSAVTLTLFIPCIAQLQFMVKERGVKTASMITIFVFVFAFVMGYIVNQSLNILGVGL
ncbi:MAG: ferrous iron transporter B [Nostocaceae cyanobacterium]|nr:ferrous iron transporter B [Nostocaceae cyanobacterium]